MLKLKKTNNHKKNIFIILWVIFSTILIALCLLFFILSFFEKNKIFEYVVISIFFLVLFFVNSTAAFFIVFKNKIKRVNSIVNSFNYNFDIQEEVHGVASIIYDDNNKILFASRWLLESGFDKYLNKGLDKLGLDKNINSFQKIKILGRDFEVKKMAENKTIFIKDTTYSTSLESAIEKLQKCIVSINILYGLKFNTNDSLKQELILKINKTLQEWANKHGGIFDKLDTIENTFLIYANWESVKTELLNEKLLILIKESVGTHKDSLNISIGVTYGEENLYDLKNKSLKSLRFSQNRGGDQIVIIDPLEEIKYIGKSSSEISINNNLQILRSFYINMNNVLKNSRNVIITSHKNADLDSIGSVIGFYQLMKVISKNEVLIFLPDLDNITSRLFNDLPKNIKDAFISKNKLDKMNLARTLCFTLDTSSTNLTQMEPYLSKISKENRFIIDHHRASNKKIQSLDNNTFIDTSVSSVSEIITNMVKIIFENKDTQVFNEHSATLLLAGIYLDSKQLTQNISQLTFDSISFLMSNRANLNKVIEIFNPPLIFLEKEKYALDNLVKIKNFIFTFLPEKITLENEEISLIADKLLKYKNVEATFVLSKTNNQNYKLSARSNGEINVQLICEGFGGGGHFNSAAVTWPQETNYNDLIRDIKKRINREK